MKLVPDTNVLVSGLLTPFGPSGEIIRMVSAGEFILCLDARVLSEYRDVLCRPKFNFNRDDVNTIIDYIRHYGEFVSTLPLKTHLPDTDDEPFLEAAISGKADVLITGNIAHYPASSRKGVKALSPSEFIKFYKNSK